MRTVKAASGLLLIFISLLLLMPAFSAGGPEEAGSGELLLASDAIGELQDTEGAVSPANGKQGLKGSETASAPAADEPFSESLARFVTNPIVVPILLTIAGLGLLLELFTPGVGIPGGIGLIALVLYFYGHFVAGIAGYGAIMLLVIGLILLAVEFILPGGIIGFFGLLLVLGSVFLAGDDFQATAVSVLIALIIASAGMVIIVKFFGKRLHLFKRVILNDSTDTESGYVSTVNRPELIGQIALSLTPLRPSGTIELGDERIDAVSEGRFIDAGKNVKIIKVEGSRIVVRELKLEEEEL